MQAATLQPGKTLSDFVRPLGNWLNSDPRHYQVLFLSLFLMYGIIGLQWDVVPVNFIITFFTCLVTQAIFTALTTQDYRSLKSAMISSLSLCLMLKTNDVYAIVLASFLSIAVKFFFRVGGKHFFNPTNFGIIVTILLTNSAWISPGQWGSNGLLLFGVGLFGLAVLYRVKRLDTAFMFLFTYAGLQFVRTQFVLGWEMDFFLHQFTSGTLLLFTFFMITDPVSTPSHKVARMIWAALVALLAFYLTTYEFINGAPLWALFFISPLTIVFDKLFKGEKFKWFPIQQTQTSSKISIQ